MARQKGIIRIQGTMGGMTFYESGGSALVKEVSTVSKERILNDPDFELTRQNMAEFGGSASVGKALRAGLAAVMRSMGDRYVSARITRLIKQINTGGSGQRGQRTIDIGAGNTVLPGFEFARTTTFSSIFNAPFTYTANAARTQITLDVPDFNAGNYISVPSGATHFRLVNAVTVLSSYLFNPASGKYDAVEPTLNGVSDVQYSGYISVSGMVGNTTTLQAVITPPSALTATVGVIGCIGIEFYQQVNATFNLMAGRNCLRLANVF